MFTVMFKVDTSATSFLKQNNDSTIQNIQTSEYAQCKNSHYLNYSQSS